MIIAMDNLKASNALGVVIDVVKMFMYLDIRVNFLTPRQALRELEVLYSVRILPISRNSWSLAGFLMSLGQGITSF